jgi:hypothetical protein
MARPTLTLFAAFALMSAFGVGAAEAQATRQIVVDGGAEIATAQVAEAAVATPVAEAAAPTAVAAAPAETVVAETAAPAAPAPAAPPVVAAPVVKAPPKRFAEGPRGYGYRARGCH